MKKKTTKQGPAIDSTELILAMEELEKESGIQKEYLLESIETALVTAYKKNYDCEDENVKIETSILKKLTEIEQEVLSFIVQGENNDSISQKLDVNTIDVQKHINSIYKKLHVSNRTQAILLATNNSL